MVDDDDGYDDYDDDGDGGDDDVDGDSARGVRLIAWDARARDSVLSVV